MIQTCSHDSVHNSCRSTEWGSVDLLSLSHCLPAGVQWLLHKLHRVQLGLVGMQHLLMEFVVSQSFQVLSNLVARFA